MTEYHLSADDLAEKSGYKSARRARERATALGLGRKYGGRIGYRYSDADVRRLVESLQVKTKESA